MQYSKNQKKDRRDLTAYVSPRPKQLRKMAIPRDKSIINKKPMGRIRTMFNLTETSGFAKPTSLTPGRDQSGEQRRREMD